MSFAANKFLPLLFCLFFFSSIAQNEFQSYSKSNGLTSSTITTSKVDSKGIVWLGTSNGISVYTGGNWVPIKAISDDKGYNKNIGQVSLIFEALNGDIWISSDKGIFVYNGKNWTFFVDPENDDFKVTEISEDRKGWIWILLEKYKSLKEVSSLGFSLVEGRVQIYNGFQWIKFQSEIGGSAATQIGDLTEYFTSHIIDMEGNIWITSLDGLYKFNYTNWTEYNQDHLPSDICNEVIETKNKDIWVATKYGVAKQDSNDWIKYEKTKGIKGNVIVDLFEDNQKRIWVITKKDSRFKNLCVFENGKWKHFTKENIKLKGNIDQLVDFNGQVIALSKKGLSLFNGKKWENLIAKYKIDDDNFGSQIVASDKAIWFAGRHGLYRLSQDRLQQIYTPVNEWKVTTVFESKDGEIWVGTEKDGVFVIDAISNENYNSENGLEDNYIKEIFEDKSGSVWIVTKGGVSKLITNS